MDLIKAGKLSHGMQKRIERGMSGEKVPGYYPLGKSPVPICGAHLAGSQHVTWVTYAVAHVPDTGGSR